MRQASARAAQTASERREGRSPLEIWWRVARYPTEESPSRTKNGTEPSSGRSTPRRNSVRPTRAPPAQARRLTRVGLVPSPRELVLVSVHLPRFEQRGGPGGSRGVDAQLGGETPQVRRHVHVVAGVGEGHRQSERLRVRQQRVTRVARAGGSGVEEVRVTRRGADEVVPAVLGRTHHQLVRLEELERRPENRWWQVRAVAVDRDDAPEVWDEALED